MADLPEILTVPEVAEVLKVSTDTVLRRIRAGEIQVIRLGPKIIRVRREALEEFMGQREGGAPAATVVSGETKPIKGGE